MYINNPSAEVREEQATFKTLFKQEFGMNYTTYLTIVLSIFINSERAFCIDLEWLKNPEESSLQAVLTDENIEQVLKSMSVNYREFSRLQNGFRVQDAYEKKFQFNYLRKCPLVITKQRTLIAPIPTFIPEKASTGVYFRLMDSLNGKAKKQFQGEHGPLFSGYVEYLLSRCYEKDVTFMSGDTHFHKDRNKGICDFIVTECESSVVLIECKGSRVLLDYQTNGDYDAFKDFVKVRYLKDGKTQFSFLSRYYRNQGKKVFSVILYNDSIDFLNHYKEIFYDDESLICALEEHEVQFIPIHEFECLIPCLKSKSLADILMSKLEEKDTAEMNFTEFARHAKLDGFGADESHFDVVSQVLLPSSSPDTK